MTLKEVFGFDKTSDLIAWFLSLSHFALSFSLYGSYAHLFK